MIEVLLSTHNGDRYLREQLASIAAQTDPRVSVSIRDDGSQDGTRALLQAWVESHPRTRVEFGERLGVLPSFLRLLETASSDAALYAFCDQDDVWVPEKLARARQALQDVPVHMPALYCARFVVTDENLVPQHTSPLPRRRLGFRHAIVENACWGFTAVVNSAARRLILRAPPNVAIAHDWWMYLVVSAFGQVIFDERPAAFYRRHQGATTTGADGTLRLKLRRFLREGGRRVVYRQAEEFARLYGAQLNAEHRAILEAFIAGGRGVRARIRYAARCETYRQGRLDNALLRVLLLIGRL